MDHRPLLIQGNAAHEEKGPRPDCIQETAGKEALKYGGGLEQELLFEYSVYSFCHDISVRIGYCLSNF